MYVVLSENHAVIWIFKWYLNQVFCLLFKVTATDKDVGKFGQVSYGVKSPQIARETFRIEGNGNLNISTMLFCNSVCSLIVSEF